MKIRFTKEIELTFISGATKGNLITHSRQFKDGEELEAYVEQVGESYHLNVLNMGMADNVPGDYFHFLSLKP